MKKIRLTALILTLIILAPLFSACAKKEPMQKTYYEYFDTVSVIYSYLGDSKKEFEANCESIRSDLEKYHRMLDIYHEYSGINNLKTVNDNAGIAPIKVDSELIDFILYAKEMYTLTGGEMNIAMGSVLSLWHDSRSAALNDPEKAGLPDTDMLTKAAEHISIDSIIVDKEASTLYISDKNLKIDAGALGKGFATERIAKRLESEGLTSYVLNIGGNIRILGTKPDGSGWITGITDPKNKDGEPIMKINIAATSCVTSGNYERFFTVGGKRYHHIIDKDTLFPAEHFSSVTVVCADSALADALSTALFCMTYEEGFSVAQEFNADVIWIYNSGEIRMTDGVKEVN